jgi:hypothetical protein
MLTAFVIVGLFVLSGCEVTYPDGEYQCGKDGLCPRGLSCDENNICRRTLGHTDNGGGGSTKRSDEPVTGVGGTDGANGIGGTGSGSGGDPGGGSGGGAAGSKSTAIGGSGGAVAGGSKSAAAGGSKSAPVGGSGGAAGGECKENSDPTKTGCPTGTDCIKVGDSHVCNPKSGSTSDSPSGLQIFFYKPGICKLLLSAGYSLNIKADWTSCTGSGVGVGADESIYTSLWPTSMGVFVGLGCSMLRSDGEINECTINSTKKIREIALIGPFESNCTYTWYQGTEGIDVLLGPGCGVCNLDFQSDKGAADFGFNESPDNQCRCPKVHFEAVAVKQD